jgi:hypothetical protein
MEPTTSAAGYRTGVEWLILVALASQFDVRNVLGHDLFLAISAVGFHRTMACREK